MRFVTESGERYWGEELMDVDSSVLESIVDVELCENPDPVIASAHLFNINWDKYWGYLHRAYDDLDMKRLYAQIQKETAHGNI